MAAADDAFSLLLQYISTFIVIVLVFFFYFSPLVERRAQSAAIILCKEKWYIRFYIPHGGLIHYGSQWNWQKVRPLWVSYAE